MRIVRDIKITQKCINYRNIIVIGLSSGVLNWLFYWNCVHSKDNTFNRGSRGLNVMCYCIYSECWVIN